MVERASPNQAAVFPNLLFGVSCASAAACTAEGFHYCGRSGGDIAKTLVETSAVCRNHAARSSPNRVPGLACASAQ